MHEHDTLVQLLDAFFRKVFMSTEPEALSALAEVDLSFTQIRVAMLLACLDEPTPINEVASQVGPSMTAVSRALDRMVELDLVERREDVNDRRVRLVSLSTEGRAVVEKHFRARRDALQGLIERLPEPHVRDLAAALQPILDGDYLRPPVDPATDTPHAPPIPMTQEETR